LNGAGPRTRAYYPYGLELLGVVGAGASFLTVEYPADDSNPLDGAPLQNSQQTNSWVKSG